MSMEDAPIELYKEFMNDISREIDREDVYKRQVQKNALRGDRKREGLWYGNADDSQGIAK